jgi:hypothetical protein
MKIIENTYTGLKLVIFILYIVVVLGVWKGAPGYLNIVENTFSIVIALALIYFFNPFLKEKTVCTNLHRKIAFSAGVAILIQTSLFQYLNPVNKINLKSNVKKIV